MHIDRSNYEIWFIDWMDGNLDNHQIEQLKLFLDQNPDLKEELNDLTTVCIVSSDISFRDKDQLVKSPSDIPSLQFEFLCTAYLENDLNSSQREEMEEIVITNADRKKTFDLIQQTRLSSPKINYRHKNLLLKRTPIQKVKGLSVIGLGAAAAISLIIITFYFNPATNPLMPKRHAQYYLPGPAPESQSPGKKEERIITDRIPVLSEIKPEERFTNHNNNEKVIANHEMMTDYSTDSMTRKIENIGIKVNRVPVYCHFEISTGIFSNSLIASNRSFNSVGIRDDRSKIGRFISKTFREKFLREKAPADTPLKGYEIAEAGVNGLNKLLGWQMALDMKNDETGQPKTVYFRSKILKVSAPIKKREPQP